MDTPDDAVFEQFSQASYVVNIRLDNPFWVQLETVSSFSFTDLKRFMARYYGSEQMLLCAAGAFEHDALVAMVEKRLSHLQNVMSPQTGKSLSGKLGKISTHAH